MSQPWELCIGFTTASKVSAKSLWEPLKMEGFRTLHVFRCFHRSFVESSGPFAGWAHGCCCPSAIANAWAPFSCRSVSSSRWLLWRHGSDASHEMAGATACEEEKVGVGPPASVNDGRATPDGDAPTVPSEDAPTIPSDYTQAPRTDCALAIPGDDDLDDPISSSPRRHGSVCLIGECSSDPGCRSMLMCDSPFHPNRKQN